MKKELHIFLTAVMFMTRIKVPAHIDHSTEYLNKSVKYFSLIGWIVGGICVLIFLVLNKYLSEDIAILASMIAGIWVTGAFHEDGFADVCDAFGGGWTKEKILSIMKDSRLGTYGVLGLIFILSTKFVLLKKLLEFASHYEQPTLNIFYPYQYFILFIIAAHSVSRLMSVFTMQFSSYVTDKDTSKSKPVTSRKLSIPALLFTTAFAIVPFLLLPLIFSLIILPVICTAYSLSQYFKKWIGGYTGDCLGAIQQVSEIVFYLSAIIVWQYIL